MSNSSAIILIDTREPDTLKEMVKAAALAKGIETMESQLPSGDYVLVFSDYTIGIERKEVGDLLNTIRDNRFMSQLAGLMGNYNTPYLLIEGVLHEHAQTGNLIVSGRETNWKAQAIHSILSSVQEQGIRLSLSSSLATTCKRLMGLYGFYSNPDHHDLTMDRLNVFHTSISPPMAMLMAIPGIGFEKAKSLLETFGSLDSISTATEASLTQARGVGTKHGREIYHAFHTPFVK